MSPGSCWRSVAKSADPVEVDASDSAGKVEDDDKSEGISCKSGEAEGNEDNDDSDVDVDASESGETLDVFFGISHFTAYMIRTCIICRPCSVEPLPTYLCAVSISTFLSCSVLPV